jgi:7-cyano-7-deazaguanine reductase
MTDQLSNLSHLSNAPLGKTSANPDKYSPELLYPIPRSTHRVLLQYGHTLPFMGVDIWNAYELSWLGPRGKPEVAIAQIEIPFDSPFMIESKSLKLYLNSLNYERFSSTEEVKLRISKDLSDAAKSTVSITFFDPQSWSQLSFDQLEGISLDRLDVQIDPQDLPNRDWLSSEINAAPVEEILFSHLLRSNCPVTGQPDWASIIISYRGPAINQENLLRYIISYRNHQEFHEHCVEKIFCDIKAKCKTAKLSVYARYTRRGGLDINPFRTDFNTAWPKNKRLARQ